MNASSDPQELARLLARIMTVDDTTLGTPLQPFVARARGRLHKPSEEAFEELAAAVLPLGLMPMFREEDGRHTVYLVRKPATPGLSAIRVNLILFVLTIFSVMFAGAVNTLPASLLPMPSAAEAADLWLGFLYQLRVSWIGIVEAVKNLPAGLPFAFSLLTVLGTHELGHYFAGRRNGTPVTLPYFIPLPIPGSFGTMGAMIAMREPPRNRNRLTEIAVAGPLAGFLVAIPILLYGLRLSTIQPLPTELAPGTGFTLEGNSIAYLAAKFAVFGRLLPAPAQYDIPPLLFWIRSFFTGFPLPMAGVDVFIHPIASGAWVGLLITGLNLIPAGQLDGGHMLYALLGEKAGRILPAIIAALVVLGFFWYGWFLWVIIIYLFGRSRAEPLDTLTPLDARHRALALLGLSLFFLLFTPIPMQAYGG